MISFICGMIGCFISGCLTRNIQDKLISNMISFIFGAASTGIALALSL